MSTESETNPHLLSKLQNQQIPDTNLQNKRAFIFQKHILGKGDETSFEEENNEYKTENAISPKPTTVADKDLEIKLLKAQIEELKQNQILLASEETKVDKAVSTVQELLPDFLHEISSPVSSIEYSAENLLSEYQKVMNDFATLFAETSSPIVLKTLEYTNTLSTQLSIPQQVENFREKKKQFLTAIAPYHFKNTQRATEYFVSAGLTGIDEELHSIISDEKGELLFQMMVSLLAIKQSFTVLNSAKNRTRYLISSLKNYTNKIPDLHNEKFELKASIEAAIVLLSHRLRSCNFLFEYKATCYVNGNIQHLAHVWINLLSNAIEATNGKGNIGLQVNSNGNVIEVRIIDNGDGIPKEIQTNIFNPYFSTKRKTGGTGIGLDICKKYIEAIGGSIEVQSVPGNTIFTVRILNNANA
jgi:signal transduction histidine kinase